MENSYHILLTSSIEGGLLTYKAANFVVPFCVSSYGFLNRCRSERPMLALKNEL